MNDPTPAPDRHVGGRPFPWSDPDLADIADADDEARWLAAVDDAAHTGHHDVEWSSEQTFTGEFGHFTAFGDPID